MRILGQDISVNLKIKLNQKNSPYRVDPAFQKKVFGSHSQYLEDLFIDSIFRGKASGTYVDIGANDPSELSNTKLFYDRGWRGVNVEPDVRMHQKLVAGRPHDTNLNIGIGNTAADLTFYELSPNTLSTFNRDSANESVRKEGAVIVSETPVRVITLAALLEEYVPGGTIDFMSVDAEGYEIEIMSSNDWKRFRPTVVIVEVNQDREASVLKLMQGNGYALVYFNGTNGIFVDTTAELICGYLAER